MKTNSIKDKFLDKPYITSTIKKSIRKRNKLQKLYTKWPLTYEATFKRYRNTLTSVIRAARNNYYNSGLREGSGNSRKTWEIINGLIGRSKSNIVSSVELINKLLTDDIVIAEGFNEYFCNVANELVQNTEQTSVSFSDLLPDPVPHSLYLSRATQVEVHETIQSLKI